MDILQGEFQTPTRRVAIERTQESLPEVNSSVPVPAGGTWLRRLFAFSGPGYMVSVGYMDPGNWATDLAGGSQFGYTLLAVILLSNLMAILLQALAASGGYQVESMSSVTIAGRRVSSTAIREALAAGSLDLAAQLLGRPYSISGRVVAGDRIGRTLGFPTANIRMRHNRPPLQGIFAVRVHGVGPRPLPGAASLGVRPTINALGAPTLEVHLLDFDGDLYGLNVRVEFLRKLRDEQKFADVEALRRQIAHDVQETRLYFADRAGAVAGAAQLGR